jgi:hypothetical protein
MFFGCCLQIGLEAGLKSRPSPDSETRAQEKSLGIPLKKRERFGLRIRQALFEPFPGSIDARFNRFDRDAKAPGSFEMRQSLNGSQQERDLKIMREHVNRRVNRAQTFLISRRFIGRGSTRRQIHRLSNILNERDGAASLSIMPAANVVTAKIDGNREKPGDKFCPGSERLDAEVSTDECFLRQLFGVRFITNVPANEAKYSYFITRHQHIQSGGVTSLECNYRWEIFINHARSMAPARLRFERFGSHL